MTTWRELRVLVHNRVDFTVEKSEHPSPHAPPLQYFVLEIHSDGTVRHSTSGRWIKTALYESAQRLGGADLEQVHAWLRGLTDYLFGVRTYDDS